MAEIGLGRDVPVVLEFASSPSPRSRQYSLHSISTEDWAMNASWRALLVAGLTAVALSTAGCKSFWHEMQPHRLHRMNQGPGMPTGAEAYSLHRPTIPAPV